MLQAKDNELQLLLRWPTATITPSDGPGRALPRSTDRLCSRVNVQRFATTREDMRGQLTGVVGTSAFSAARPIVPVSPALSHSTPSKSKAYMYACEPRDWLCAVAVPCVLSDMMASGAAERLRMSGWIFSWVLERTHGDNGDVLRCVEPCTSSLDSFTCKPVVTCERRADCS